MCLDFRTNFCVFSLPMLWSLQPMFLWWRGGSKASQHRYLRQLHRWRSLSELHCKYHLDIAHKKSYKLKDSLLFIEENSLAAHDTFQMVFMCPAPLCGNERLCCLCFSPWNFWVISWTWTLENEIILMITVLNFCFNSITLRESTVRNVWLATIDLTASLVTLLMHAAVSIYQTLSLLLM